MRDEISEITKPLSTEIVDKLRVEILAEQIIPGTKLTEQAISKEYGISRTPVREALRSLEKEGLIEVIPNRGAFVSGLSAAAIADIYTLRIQNEMQAIRWAIERRTPEQLESIEEILDFMRFYTERGDTNRMRVVNAEFHSRISSASGSRFLIDSLSRIQEYIKFSVHVLPYRKSDLEIIQKEHKAIYAAFKKNDPEAGAQAMKRHIEQSLKRAKHART